jgi:sulfate adenylyltransferase subunit 2
VSLPTPEIAQLNARRKRAVQLRVDGRSLTQIQRETGLSVPTILKACQAFTDGGWLAIDVGARGRPRGRGRRLDARQENDLRRWALQGPPELQGLPAGLWDAHSLQRLAQQHFEVDLAPRALSRLQERWGLAAVALRDAALRTAAGRTWFDDAWSIEMNRARAPGDALFWCGALAHPDLATGAGLLVALNPRGTLHWLAVPALASQDSYIDFLDRLTRHVAGVGAGAGGEGVAEPALAASEARWTVFFHGPDFSRAEKLSTWLKARAGLDLRACPVAPVARRAPEHAWPAAAASAQSTTAAPTVTAPLENSPSVPGLVQDLSLLPNPSPRTMSQPQTLTHLQRLEAESIHIMREVVAEVEKPVMLYSIGKDSAVMLHLARKAFYPAPPPFPLLHVDTTWKFRAMYEMRGRMAAEMGMELLVHQNPEAAALGINPFTHGSSIHTDMWKTQGLKQALDKYGFQAAFGGARRDEEKSRAKERIFSFRSAAHRWDPKNQRPELWRLYNARMQKGESIRIFPISNWTELDIWQYISLESIPIVPLYFAAERPVVERDGTLIMVDDERMPLKDGEVPMMKKVRFRTLGCYPLSGAVESEADTLSAVIQEMLLTRTSERQGRMIDHDAAASMEKKKQEGYF